ncbi:unnamed protein product [Absidia cylindrospora]
MELVLGKHNGIVIKGKNPRRPRMRKEEERMLLELTLRLNQLAEDKAKLTAATGTMIQQQQQQQQKRHVMDMIKSDKWTVEERTPGEYTIILQFTPPLSLHSHSQPNWMVSTATHARDLHHATCLVIERP